MNKPAYRKRYLFARSIGDVVKNATRPMMDKQGKVYGALLANWGQIVGEARAKVTRPARLQFPASEAEGATLHLDVHPAIAAELQYEHAQIIEQCARHFGYRAITRIVMHPAHDMMAVKSAPRSADLERSGKGELASLPARAGAAGERGGSGSDGGSAPSAPEAPPDTMRELLQRLKSRINKDGAL